MQKKRETQAGLTAGFRRGRGIGATKAKSWKKPVGLNPIGRATSPARRLQAVLARLIHAGMSRQLGKCLEAAL